MEWEHKIIADTIEQWQYNIISRFEKGDHVITDLTGTKWTWTWKSDGSNVMDQMEHIPMCSCHGCRYCVYGIYYGHGCMDYGKVGDMWWRKHDMETAMNMLNSLLKMKNNWKKTMEKHEWKKTLQSEVFQI